MTPIADNHAPDAKLQLLCLFSRLQLPAVGLAMEKFTVHLQRMFQLFAKKETGTNWDAFLDELYPLDAFLAAACLEGDRAGWETLFAARAGRADRLLVDALRARAVRLFPRNEEKQDSAVTDFWGHLIVSETPGAVPILARYDGQRPLVPWLIRIFQNWQISKLRARSGRAAALAEDDLLEAHDLPNDLEQRWHESFCSAARDWLGTLPDAELLLLGLRLRYRLSQREVANLLGVHEGTISRRITDLRDGCFEFVGKRLLDEGWTGDDLTAFVYSEMESLLMDEVRLAADNLAHILGRQGKKLPA